MILVSQLTMTSINTNIRALNASAKLSGNAVEQTTAMQRLSTGVRVNSAKDDAAALAISTGLISQIKGMAVATRNVADGISLAQTAESALGSVVNMLQRMRELAVQSANGTLTTANRAAIQLEYDTNINQINTVLGTTNFNGIKLFDGSASALKIQSGVNIVNKNNINIPQMTSLSLLGVSGTDSEQNVTNLPPVLNTVTKSQSYTLLSSNNYTNPIYVDNNITIDGNGILDGATVMITNADSAHDVLMLTSPNGITSSYNSSTGVLKLSGKASIADYQAALRLVQFKTDGSAQTGKRDIQFTLGNAIQGINGNFYEIIPNNANWFQALSDANNSTYFGLKGYLVTVTSQVENDFIAQKLHVDSWIGATDDFNQINTALGFHLYPDQTASEGNWYWISGPDKGTQIYSNNAPNTLYSNWNAGEPNGGAGENFIDIFSTFNGKWNDIHSNRIEMSYAIVEYENTKKLKITANSLIDVGNNSPVITESPPAVRIAPGVTTELNANQSLAVIDDAIAKVTDLRTYLGAIQNSLQDVIDNLTSSGTNAQQANGRQIDTDYAETTTQLSRSQIISQAATAMLAQANQSSQLVLQLLKP